MTAEIACFHKPYRYLHRESLALNPLHWLIVYSFFNYTQSQVSTATDTVRQCYKGRKVSPGNFVSCSELPNWCPWLTTVELIHAKCLNSPVALTIHRGCFLVGPSGVVWAPTSSKLWKCVLPQIQSPLSSPSFSLGNSLLCLRISASKAVKMRAAGLSSGVEGTERLTSMGQRWRLCLKWAESWYYWKGWTWHPCLIIDCESLMEEKIVKCIKMRSECKSINENYSHTGY